MERPKKIVSGIGAMALLAGVATLYGVNASLPSDHQDSPATVARPGLDITDVYAFPANDPNKVVFAMDIHPLIPSGMGNDYSFDPGVMYQIKIDSVGDHREHLVMQFKASGIGRHQKVAMYGPGRPNLQGTTSTFIREIGATTFGNGGTLPNGVRFFAGPREEPFYFDLTRFLMINPDRDYKNHPNPPPPSATCFRKPGQARDFFTGFNVLSLVVEAPRKMFAAPSGRVGRINVWATTSIGKSGGSYVQMERLARPAVKEAFERFADHDKTNRSSPYDDPTLSRSIYDFAVAKKPAGAGRSPAIARALVKTLTPDEMEVDLSQMGPARYLAVETNGKSGLPVGAIRAVPPKGILGIKMALGDPYRHFGGRDLKSPVMDLSLGAIYGSLVPKLGLAKADGNDTPCLTSDNVQPNDKHELAGFPYLGKPQ